MDLKDYMDSGVVYVDDTNYIGIASDGVHVILGDIDDLTSIENYLAAYPNPDNW